MGWQFACVDCTCVEASQLPLLRRSPWTAPLHREPGSGALPSVPGGPGAEPPRAVPPSGCLHGPPSKSLKPASNRLRLRGPPSR
jgi:hypothetical protein